MEKKNLQELFRRKITLEIKQYKKNMLKRKPEEIFSKSSQISAMMNIYKLLLVKSLCMTEQALQLMLCFPNTMALFYRVHRERKETVKENLEESIDITLEKMHELYQKVIEEEQEVNAA